MNPCCGHCRHWAQFDENKGLCKHPAELPANLPACYGRYAMNGWQGKDCPCFEKKEDQNG